MPFDYDELYKKQPEALGGPTQQFVDFFAGLKTGPLRVLDIGCGQGRDALFIARLGHHVTGIDISPKGIDDLLQSAREEGLDIDCYVMDISEQRPEGEFDVLLIDRTLHMLPDNARIIALKTLLGNLGNSGTVLIADEPSNMTAISNCVVSSFQNHKIVFENKGTLFLTVKGAI